MTKASGINQQVKRDLFQSYSELSWKLTERVWHPAADVYQTQEGWLVKLDLAGVRQEDLQVSIEGSHVRVRGVRRDWLLEQGCRQQSLEISYSRFERDVQLPGVDELAIVASEYRDGMLLLKVRGKRKPA